jgi:hypothetical protein
MVVQNNSAADDCSVRANKTRPPAVTQNDGERGMAAAIGGCVLRTPKLQRDVGNRKEVRRHGCRVHGLPSAGVAQEHRPRPGEGHGGGKQVCSLTVSLEGAKRRAHVGVCGRRVKDIDGSIRMANG